MSRWSKFLPILPPLVFINNISVAHCGGPGGGGAREGSGRKAKQPGSDAESTALIERLKAELKAKEMTITAFTARHKK